MFTLTQWRPVSLAADGPGIATSLTDNETAELQRLAAGKEVLEIGSAYGYSAIAMALAGARRVTAVDPHSELASYGSMVANTEAYGVAGLIEIVRGDSFTVMPELHRQGRLYDLVWIDGDHAAAVVAHDVEWALKLLRLDGTLICHDYDESTCPHVRTALDAWKVPPKVVDTVAVYGPGEW